MSAYGLTIKQERFAEQYLKHRNASKAYAEAGYSVKGWSKNAIYVAAHRVLKNTKVQLRINTHLEKATEIADYSKAQAIDDARADRELARELGQAGAAVSAGRLAADLSGYIVDRKDITHRRIADTPTEELEAQLAELESEEAGANETRH